MVQLSNEIDVLEELVFLSLENFISQESLPLESHGLMLREKVFLETKHQ